jgi:heptosyltransferase-2
MSFKQNIKAPVLSTIFTLGKLRGNNCRHRAIDINRANRLLLIQLGGIGDVILTFPLLRQLKQTFPDKSLHTLTEHGGWLFELAPDLRAGITHQQLDLSQGYREKLARIRGFSKEGIDLVISTARGDGAVESSVIAWLTGAGIRIGYRQEGSSFLYTHTRDFSYQRPIVEQNLGLLELLQSPTAESRLGLGVSAEFENSVQHRLASVCAAGGPVIVFHPFAGNFAEFKSWPIGRYAQLAGRLLEAFPARIMVLGSANDRDVWEAAGQGGQRLTNLCGELSFAETAALIRQADLFIGNDSSLLHLAEDFGTPAIGIFGSTSPAQILPSGHRTTVIRRSLDCSPCYLHQPLHQHRCRNRERLKCLNDIDVNCIFQAATETLIASALRGKHHAHRH